MSYLNENGDRLERRLKSEAVRRLMLALGAEGTFIANWVNHDPAFAQECANQIKSFREKREERPGTPAEMAEDIMGTNVFGIGDAAINFANAEILDTLRPHFCVVPYSVKTLREVRDSHILFAFLPLTFLEILGKYCVHVKRPPDQYAWVKKCSFANEKLESGWWLLSKELIYSKKPLALIDFDLAHSLYRTPHATLLLYAMAARKMSVEEHLFQGLFARTSCRDNDGFPIHIGYEGERLCIGSYPESNPHKKIGVACIKGQGIA